MGGVEAGNMPSLQILDRGIVKMEAHLVAFTLSYLGQLEQVLAVPVGGSRCWLSKECDGFECRFRQPWKTAAFTPT